MRLKLPLFSHYFSDLLLTSFGNCLNGKHDIDSTGQLPFIKYIILHLKLRTFPEDSEYFLFFTSSRYHLACYKINDLTPAM